MDPSPTPSEDPTQRRTEDRLGSWKAIAAYLKRAPFSDGRSPKGCRCTGTCTRSAVFGVRLPSGARHVVGEPRLASRWAASPAGCRGARRGGHDKTGPSLVAPCGTARHRRDRLADLDPRAGRDGPAERCQVLAPDRVRRCRTRGRAVPRRQVRRLSPGLVRTDRRVGHVYRRVPQPDAGSRTGAAQRRPAHRRVLAGWGTGALLGAQFDTGGRPAGDQRLVGADNGGRAATLPARGAAEVDWASDGTRVVYHPPAKAIRFSSPIPSIARGADPRGLAGCSQSLSAVGSGRCLRLLRAGRTGGRYR